MASEQVKCIDDVLALARTAAPLPLSELEMRLLARSALAAAQTPAPSPRPRTARLGPMLLAGSLLALSLLGLIWGMQARQPGIAIEVGHDDRALRLSLRSGDTVIAAPDTALQIVAQEALERRVSLTRGSALFDVVPLASGQLFEVETHDARVRVLGTVFSVEVESGRTVVRVYEGRVFVSGRTLHRGEVWVSSGALPPTERVPSLAAEGERHAWMRAASAGPSPTVLPLPSPMPLGVVTGGGPETPGDAPALARVYAEATRRLYALGDAVGALGLLDAYDLDADEGLFRERATVLRVDALLRLGHAAQAAEVARRYVLREPETHTSARMRAIAAGRVGADTARE